MKCSNCKEAETAPQNVLCVYCLDLYFNGVEVQGRGGPIQCQDGPPVGYQPPPPRDQLDLFK